MTVPKDIRRFETLQLASILIGLIHWYLVSTGEVLNVAIDVAFQIALTLMVSRKRKNWARWTLAALFLLGVIYKAVYFRETLSIGYPMITLSTAMLQAAALVLLFTPRSSEWLRHAPATA